jgi:hypothetical protein
MGILNCEMQLSAANSRSALSEGDHVTSQNHFTLSFPIKAIFAQPLEKV